MRLEIGGGLSPREGYEHLDIKPFPHVEHVADARKLPFQDRSVSEIYSSNVIEHFWWFEITALLTEWCRVLRPGGRIEIHTPDAEFIMQQFFSGAWQNDVRACPKEAGYHWIYNSDTDRNMWLNFKLHGTSSPGNAHVTSFSFEMMRTCLEKAGFKGINRLTPPGTTLSVEAFKGVA